MEVFHGPILRRCSKAVQVINIAHGLKVSTADKEVNRFSSSLANVFDSCIQRVQLTMAATIDSHLYAASALRT